MKTCVACKKEKPLEEFPPNRKNKSGLNVKCRDCYNDYMRNWYARNKQKHIARVKESKSHNSKRARLMSLYGLTEEEFYSLKNKYDGMCWCCRERKATCVDHCHKTGRVRGILCMACNTAIGKLGDDIEGLQKAIRYLSG